MALKHKDYQPLPVTRSIPDTHLSNEMGLADAQEIRDDDGESQGSDDDMDEDSENEQSEQGRLQRKTKTNELSPLIVLREQAIASGI